MLDKVCTLPHSQESEKLILGALIRDNSLHDNLGDSVFPSLFFDALHKKLFEYICLIKQKGTVANEISLNLFLSSDSDFISAGGISYLVELSTAASVPVHIKAHIEILWSTYLRRSVIRIANNMIQSAYNMDISNPPEAQIDFGIQKLFELTNDTKAREESQSFGTLISNYIQSVDKAKADPLSMHGITSGFSDLDNLLGGFKNSDLIIIAARPSMGKTALSINIGINAAEAVAKHNKNIAIFSMEMSADQIVSRIVSVKCNLSPNKILSGKLSAHEYSKVIDTATQLSNLPLIIDDTPALTINALKTRIRVLHYTQKVGMVIIDYLQLIHSFGNKGAFQNRVLEIATITQGLKEIARELSIPVIVLSQLSRAVETREDKKPQLSDLRDSGSIEQDADVVMFLYREEYYISRKKPSDCSGIKLQEWQNKMNKVINVADVLITKHRNGPIGDVKLYFDSRTGLFKNYTDKYHE